MEKIKRKSVIIQHYTQDWSRSKGVYLYTKENTSEEIAVNKEDLRKLKKEIIKEGFKTEKFDEKDIVFFHSSCTFPRNKFRELYPKTKIVVKLEKATAIIVDKDNLINTINHMRDYGWTYYKTSEGFFARVKELEDPIYKSERENLVLVEESKYSLNIKELEFIDFFIDNTIKLIDVDSIELKSDLVVDETAFNTLNQLLSSGVPANIQLALSMIPAFDYKKSRQRLAILLRMNPEWISCKDKKTFIDLKTVIDRLKKDFDDVIVSYRNNISNDTINRMNVEFFMDAFSRFSGDEVIEKAINNWLNKVFECENGKVKIIMTRNEQVSN